MKTCPVCSARCFDDMEVCYGCLYVFAEQASSDLLAEGEEEFEPEEVSEQAFQKTLGLASDEIPTALNCANRPTQANTETAKSVDSPKHCDGTTLLGEQDCEYEQDSCKVNASQPVSQTHHGNPRASFSVPLEFEFIDEACVGIQVRVPTEILQAALLRCATRRKPCKEN